MTATRKVDFTRDDEVFTGADRTLRFTVLDSASAAVNITGWALSWALYQKAAPAGQGTLVSKTTVSGITLTTPSSGIADVALADTDTDDLKGDADYYYELRRTDAGSEDVLACGSFHLCQSAKR